ncbi:MAG: hypothetical protein ACHQIM_07835 [Sphingobacteriales bacterium]
MKRDYLAENAEKKRTTNKAMWAFWIFIILFILVIIRFSIRSDADDSISTSAPTADDAYEIAKDYIRPTLKPHEVKFPDGEYQYAKTSDSVFVVKSYFETRDEDNRKVKTYFTVTLRYNGGANLNDRSWTLENMIQH